MENDAWIYRITGSKRVARWTIGKQGRFPVAKRQDNITSLLSLHGCPHPCATPGHRRRHTHSHPSWFFSQIVQKYSLYDHKDQISLKALASLDAVILRWYLYDKTFGINLTELIEKVILAGDCGRYTFMGNIFLCFCDDRVLSTFSLLCEQYILAVAFNRRLQWDDHSWQKKHRIVLLEQSLSYTWEVNLLWVNYMLNNTYLY